MLNNSSVKLSGKLALQNKMLVPRLLFCVSSCVTGSLWSMFFCHCLLHQNSYCIPVPIPSEIHRKVSSKKVLRGSISAVSLASPVPRAAGDPEEKKPCCRNLWWGKPPSGGGGVTVEQYGATCPTHPYYDLMWYRALHLPLVILPKGCTSDWKEWCWARPLWCDTVTWRQTEWVFHS